MSKKGLFIVTLGLCLIIMPAMFILTPAFAKTINITVNDHNPPMAPPAKALVAWANKVNELCDGKVKLTVHGGGTILKGNEAFRGVQKGVVNVANSSLTQSASNLQVLFSFHQEFGQQQS